MRSYLHTIARHKAYIEKLLLWIKIKQKDLKTCIDHTPSCVHFVRKKGRGHCTFHQESRYPDRKRLIYLQSLTLPVKQLLLKRD